MIENSDKRYSTLQTAWISDVTETSEFWNTLRSADGSGSTAQRLTQVVDIANRGGVTPGTRSAKALVGAGPVQGALSTLNAGVAPKLSARVTVGTNYAENVDIRATGLVRPTSVAELQGLVRDASSIRVLGKGHSFTEILGSDGLLVDMQGLRDITIAADRQTVRVQAGATVRALKDALAAAGLQLVTAPMIQDVTVGGALATASHGTGLSVSSFSDTVKSMTIIESSKGELITPTEAEMRALRASLGTAVVAEVELSVLPLTDMLVTETVVRDVAGLRAGLLDTFRGHERADAFYFPGDITRTTIFGNADTKGSWALVRTFDPGTPENTEGVERLDSTWSQIKNWWREEVFGTKVATALYHASATATKVNSKIGARVKDAVAEFGALGFADRSFVLSGAEANHYFPGHVVVRTMEYSMPLEQADHVWQAIDDTLKEFARLEPAYVPDMAFYFRCLKGSDKTILSPSYGRDSIIVEAYSHKANPTSYDQAFMRAIAERLQALGGRSHLAKIMFSSQKPAYDPEQWQEFKRVQAKFDPAGKYLSAWTRGFLDDAGAEAAAPSAPPSATTPTSPAVAELRRLGQSDLAKELEGLWLSSGKSPNSRSLRAFAQHVVERKRALQRSIKGGILPVDKTQSIVATIAATDGALNDIAALADATSSAGLETVRAAATGLHGSLAGVTVDTRGRFVLQVRAEGYHRSFSVLPAGRVIGTADLRGAAAKWPARGISFQRSQVGALVRELADLQGNRDGLWYNESEQANEHSGPMARTSAVAMMRSALDVGFTVDDELAALRHHRSLAEQRWGRPVITAEMESELRDGEVFALHKTIALARLGRTPDDVTEHFVNAVGSVAGEAIAPRRIFTQHFRPTTEKPSGRVVVVSPGYQETGRTFYEQIALLNAAGHDVVTMDHQWGGQTDGEPGQVDRGFGVARDVAAVAAYAQQLAKQWYGDEGQVALMGTSMGGGPGVFSAAVLNDHDQISLQGPAMPKALPMVLQSALLGISESFTNFVLSVVGSIPMVGGMELWSNNLLPDVTSDPINEQKIAQGHVLEDLHAQGRGMNAAADDLEYVLNMVRAGQVPKGKVAMIHSRNDSLANPELITEVAAKLGIEPKWLDGENHVLARNLAHQHHAIEAMNELLKRP